MFSIVAAVNSTKARDEARRERLPSSVYAFLRNLARICDTDQLNVLADRTGIPRQSLYNLSHGGKELPSVERLLAAAARLRVLLDTLVVGVDANYDAVAQKLRRVPSDRAPAEVEPTHPVTPSPQGPARQEEGRLMSEWARLTGQFVDGLKDEAIREEAYDALQLWVAQRLVSRKDPPQPAAKEGL